MPFELLKKQEQEIWMKISGQVSVEDYEKLQSLILSSLAVYNDCRMVFILDDFKGWSKDNRWDEILFMQEHQDKVQKIAIVGDEKWKDEVFMFTGKPFRKTEIEFFPENQLDQAKQWLSASN
jgi:hypothetical protein